MQPRVRLVLQPLLESRKQARFPDPRLARQQYNLTVSCFRPAPTPPQQFDGVNIAARLEGIAQPGGICISEDAYRQVRGKIEAEFTDIGEQSLKNIAQPLRVYRAGPASAPDRLTAPPTV